MVLNNRHLFQLIIYLKILLSIILFSGCKSNSNNSDFKNGDEWRIDSMINKVYFSTKERTNDINHRIVGEVYGCYLIETTQSTSNLNNSYKMCS